MIFMQSGMRPTRGMPVRASDQSAIPSLVWSNPSYGPPSHPRYAGAPPPVPPRRRIRPGGRAVVRSVLARSPLRRGRPARPLSSCRPSRRRPGLWPRGGPPPGPFARPPGLLLGRFVPVLGVVPVGPPRRPPPPLRRGRPGFEAEYGKQGRRRPLWPPAPFSVIMGGCSPVSRASPPEAGPQGP